jgi:plastocyanin
MTRRLLLSAGAVAAVVVTAGVADVAIGAVTSSAKVSADAKGALRFHPSRLTVKAGKVKITLTNPASSGKPHGLAVEGHGVDRDSKIITAGHRTSLTLRLKRGTYKFYCPGKGHEGAGMVGKLVVR